MTRTFKGLVPYITAREDEEPAPLIALRARFGPGGRSLLGYWDEVPEDRDTRGVLWSRCSQSIGHDRMPVGRPRWRMVHPARQRETMLKLRCQVCAGPARTPDGRYLFLESGKLEASTRLVWTAQPPVCVDHARAAAEVCPHLSRSGHVALLVRAAPLFGVIGTPYQWTSAGMRALPADDVPVPYGHPNLGWFLASQLVRELRDVETVDLDHPMLTSRTKLDTEPATTVAKPPTSPPPEHTRPREGGATGTRPRVTATSG
ncbi:hypothetical protein DMH02_008695 [Streptomyces sp. WAC 00631]|uniref:hypothetical protein n=1 Tax=Streptomyces sp. WAC 00631 TaxID=2203201 RepID=UPI00163B81D3|nr:hypothetical protein [Streptomyces sp. WAC 00631]MCC5033294.1 hypothetical protein [Streptomyces sp. WAC 00631]